MTKIGCQDIDAFNLGGNKLQDELDLFQMQLVAL